MTTATTRGLEHLSGRYVIDPQHTRIGFVVRHAMVTKVRGSFDDFEAVAVLDGADPSRSSATVTIDAASVNTRNAERDEHLRSEDFLDVARFPRITFVSTGVRQLSDSVFEMSGDLTIKRVTRPVTIPFAFEGAAQDPFGDERLGFDGSVAISRKDFGITWNAALETGGVLVADKVLLEFEVSAVKSD